MKILATIRDRHIAPRFDLTTEIFIAEAEGGKILGEPRNILLPGPSSDELCSLIIKEGVNLVVCGGIEEAHFQYLGWKKITVIDRVIGQTSRVLQLAAAGKLHSGAIIHSPPERPSP